MAALRSFTALQRRDFVQSNPHTDMVKPAASYSTRRCARCSCSLSCSARLGSLEGTMQMGFLEGTVQMGFLEGNGKLKVSSAGATARSAEMAMESEIGVSYEKLQTLLAAGEWELADEETRRLIIVLAGENAVKRKYVFFSEVQFMPMTDLATIDRLWRTHSNGKFGYSVQRKIMKRVNGDCTEFFKKVGWMKLLGSESAQFTYRSFPAEFTWELSASTPEGHLPLTNALRGTQLLKCLLDHPAFDFADDELQVPSALSSPSDTLVGNAKPAVQQNQQQKMPLSLNYSF